MALFKVSSETLRPARSARCISRFLHDQTLEDLLADHRIGGHLLPFGAQAVLDSRKLLIDLRFQHHTVIHHGGDPVEQLTLGFYFPGLGQGLQA